MTNLHARDRHVLLSSTEHKLDLGVYLMRKGTPALPMTPDIHDP